MEKTPNDHENHFVVYVRWDVILEWKASEITENPGLAGFEIEGMKEAVKPKIVVEIRMDGKVTRQSFNIDASKAIRMDFSRLLFSQELKVLEMDRIDGLNSPFYRYKISAQE